MLSIFRDETETKNVVILVLLIFAGEVDILLIDLIKNLTLRENLIKFLLAVGVQFLFCGIEISALHLCECHVIV